MLPPVISFDGNVIAFDSLASNLVLGDTNAAADIFVHDRQTGQTTRVSVDSAGTEGNAGSYEPFISADGRYVVFESLASNLVLGDTNTVGDIFVHDRQTGLTTRVSVHSSGNETNDDRFDQVESDTSELLGVTLFGIEAVERDDLIALQSLRTCPQAGNRVDRSGNRFWVW